MGNIDDAAKNYTQALNIDPDRVAARVNFAILMLPIDTDTAILKCDLALENVPNLAQAMHCLGVAHRIKGNGERALEFLEQCLAINPNFLEAYDEIAKIKVALGDLAGAEQCLITALELEPDFARAHFSLSQIKVYSQEDAQFSAMLALFKRRNITCDDRIMLSFSLAKASDDLGGFSGGFRFLAVGNALRAKSLKYDISEDQEVFSKIKTSAENTSLDISASQNPRSYEFSPIFIVGMPRSGTTLTEKIIGSHYSVTAGGELPFMPLHALKFATGDQEITLRDMLLVRDKYLASADNLVLGKRFITDKQPFNFLYIDIIFRAFPDAKIVVCERDMRAVCWSHYRTLFKGRLAYAYNITTLVQYCQLYRSLMGFWDDRFGDRIYHFDYDVMVSDQEVQIKDLLRYLDLPWDVACLSPHENKYVVNTPSVLQVSKKIYTESSEAWRNYESFVASKINYLRN